MKRTALSIFIAIVGISFLHACAPPRYDYGYRELLYAGKVEQGSVLREFSPEPELEDKILALDPKHITETDVREVLSHGPAPRIINIHGGVYYVRPVMISFSRFLTLMGYPEAKIRNPRDGSYSYSCYENSEKLAGFIAWYYEKEGMRPMLVGHSQGGMQVVKVLHELAGSFKEKIPVWNPLTEQSEERYYIVDPLSSLERPVVGIKLSYATAVGAGGITRLIPNQWSMLTRLRKIPDSVEEFTGFYKGLDLYGGDFLGFGPSNHYHPIGSAKVRNVRLPAWYRHGKIPATEHLAESWEIKDWINNYIPSEKPELNVEFKSSSTNILWAADVWHSIKKHWCLEAQRLIRARRSMRNGD